MAKDKKKVKTKPDKPQQNGVEKPTAASGNSNIWQDERFQHLVSDPRFKNLPKVQRKVKIDKRFQGMFTNEKFKVKYTVDKYGRRVNKSNADDLRKYYELNSSDEEEEEKEDKAESEADGEPEKSSDSEEEDSEAEREKEEKAIIQESDVDENDALTSDDEEVPKSLRQRLLDPNIDYARGEGRLITDSSSDDESSEDEEDPEMYIDHVWGELDNDADTTDESTRRLAVCNMDWDRVRAVDLMVLFNSFLPRGGSILSIKIYPSQFGKERMKEEELHGPPELVGLDKDSRKQQQKEKKSSASDDEDDDDLVVAQDSDAEEGDEYHMEKLRQYQLNRLRYYYAVVELDSIETADKIYKECDGIEYESSATKVDLRYIPDDTTFDEDEPTDVCTEMPDMNTYQPRQFTTTALQQAKVDLTWDETAVDRKELGDKLSSGKLEGISDQDLRKIVAYSSEEEEEEDDEEEDNEDAEVKQNETAVKEEKPDEKTKKRKSKKKEEVINKYKALLAEINEKEQKEKEKKNYAMEFTWEVNEGNENADDKDKKETFEGKPKSELTPIEKVLLKRSEKNKRRKEERKKKKLQAAGVDSESDLDSLPEGIDMSDPYFAEEFANGDFIDPKAKRKEKQKKQRQLKAEQEEEDEKNAKELELLLDDNEEDHKKQHFSLEKILKQEQETKSKKKRKKQLKKSKADIEESNKPIEDNFKLNIDDDRFKAVFTSHEFNIDPTDPHFKKTKAMEQLIHEKIKRRHQDEDAGKSNGAAKDENEGPDPAKKPKKNIENIMLVKNLKRKIQMKQQQQGR
ncbi:ESF1 homolog [Musca vetustissima]|uniref:ESF1 homolog n=1 Tax=Musca vetustissima TaxID=27455 RepID=UPI002AB6C96F|nr:ESF1 homolog [Musca vetustissima]